MLKAWGPALVGLASTVVLGAVFFVGPHLATHAPAAAPPAAAQGFLQARARRLRVGTSALPTAAGPTTAGPSEQPRAPEFLYIQPPHTATGAVHQQLWRDVPQTQDTRINLLPRHGLYRGEHAGPAARAWARKVAANRHVSAAQFVNHLGQREWDRLVTFSFVRSPFERVLSAAAWLGVVDGGVAKRNRTAEQNVAAFRRWAASGRQAEAQLAYLTPLCDMLLRDGQLLVDYVGRVPSLQHDYDTVCQTLLHVRPSNFSTGHCIRGCPKDAESRTVDSSALNQAQHHAMSWRAFYDRRTWDWVAGLYACDLQHWYPDLRFEPVPTER